MKRRGALLLAMLGVVLALAGCSAEDEIHLGKGDDGDAVAVKVGGTVTVALRGNPTTGYSWLVVDGYEKVLRKTDEDFEADSSALGSGGTQTLTFEAMAAGSTTLKLEYRRPWETTATPEQTFQVEVTAE